MKFCGDCIYLRPSEEKQTEKHEDHMCLYYHTKVYHWVFHPRIVRYKLCKEYEETP